MRTEHCPSLKRLSFSRKELLFPFIYAVSFLVYAAVTSGMEPDRMRSLTAEVLLIFSGIAFCRKLLAPFFGVRTTCKTIYCQASKAWGIQMIANLCVFQEIKNHPQMENPPSPFAEYFQTSLAMIPAVVAEEFFVLFVLLVVYNTLPLRNHVRALIAVMVSSLAFGILHIFSWNAEYAVMIFITRIGVEFYFLRIMDIKPFILFHILNNWTAIAKYRDVSPMGMIWVFVLMAPCMGWLTVKFDALFRERLYSMLFVKDKYER